MEITLHVLIVNAHIDVLRRNRFMTKEMNEMAKLTYIFRAGAIRVFAIHIKAVVVNATLFARHDQQIGPNCVRSVCLFAPSSPHWPWRHKPTDSQKNTGKTLNDSTKEMTIYFLPVCYVTFF